MLRLDVLHVHIVAKNTENTKPNKGFNRKTFNFSLSWCRFYTNCTEHTWRCLTPALLKLSHHYWLNPSVQIAVLA